MSELAVVYQIGSALAQEADARLMSFWKQFNRSFPTEQDCVEELFRKLQREIGMRCRTCASSNIEKAYGERSFKCKDCKKDTWFTAWTFFHRMKFARPYLAFILLNESGIVVSKSRFQKLLCIGNATASDIFLRLAMVISGTIDQLEKSVPSSMFVQLFSKRSRETPAREHPASEEYELVKESLSQSQSPGTPIANSSISTTLLQRNLPDLSDEEMKVLSLFSEKPINFERLIDLSGMSVGELSSALVNLELNGIAKRLPGEQYICIQVHSLVEPCTHTQSKLADHASAQLVQSLISFFRFHYRGISRKYLQYYLASYWCQFDKVKWPAGSLLKACANFRVVESKEIVNYVSPALVRLPS